MGFKKKSKQACLLGIVCILALFGCGKEKKTDEAGGSVMLVNRCFTEEGIVQQNNSRTGKVDYFDYKTKSYRPLCGAPSCPHNSEECFAFYLRKHTDIIGRLGERWYYQKDKPDGSRVFCSSSLDGQDEKEIGEFSHGKAVGAALFFDHFLMTATVDWFINEETGEVDENGKCGIYRYDLESGEEELLVPERESLWDAYCVYGCYENRLVYLEQTDEEGMEYGLRIKDLGTGDVTKPLGDLLFWPVSPYAMEGSTLVCNAKEGESRKVIELDVESGEWKEIPKEQEGGVAEIFWTKDLKLLEFREDVDGKSIRKVWQYGENGDAVLVRETEGYPWFRPLGIADDLLVGQYGEEQVSRDDGFELGTIPVEDYLAGKNNFTLLKY